jgi:hypothetical protein
VSGSAQVFGLARVFGLAQVSGSAIICEDMRVDRHLSATRSDGYTFTIAPSASGGYWITAGCHRFRTFAVARAHWALTRAGTPLGDETFAALDYLERVYAIYYPTPQGG